jgi:hypothetical protein
LRHEDRGIEDRGRRITAREGGWIGKRIGKRIAA